jgi:hypothetical protein
MVFARARERAVKDEPDCRSGTGFGDASAASFTSLAPRRGGLPQTRLLLADRLKRRSQCGTDASLADGSLFMYPSSSGERRHQKSQYLPEGRAGRVRQRIGRTTG